MPAHLTPRSGCPPILKSQKIVNLALSPAMIFGRERIDAGIDADVANEELRALDKVRYLINGSSAETTHGNRHRCAPSPPSQGTICVRNPSSQEDFCGSDTRDARSNFLGRAPRLARRYALNETAPLPGEVERSWAVLAATLLSLRGACVRRSTLRF